VPVWGHVANVELTLHDFSAAILETYIAKTGMTYLQQVADINSNF